MVFWNKIIEFYRLRVMFDADIHICSMNGNLDGLNELIAAGGVDINESGEYGNTSLHEGSRYGHLEVVKALIRAKADVRIENDQGKAPVDVASTNEIRQYIHEHHPWQRRRPLILTRAHDDHATNGDHKLTALGNIVTATRSDKVELFDIKRIIVSFL